jgi:hypothetical protein
LFFNLIKWLLIISGVYGVVMIFHLVDNFGAGNEKDHDDEHEGDSMVAGSLAGHGDGIPDDVQPWINVGLIVITLWIFYPVIQYNHNKLVK